MSDPKTRVTVGLSDRVVQLAMGEAKRNGISFADQIRRSLDKWADDIEAAKAKGNEKVLVLDRESGRLLNAR